MGWGTTFNTDVYISRQILDANTASDRLEELNSLIAKSGSIIKMYAISTPKDIVAIDSGESAVSYINAEIEDHIEMYGEYLIERFKIELYIDSLKCLISK